MHRIIFRHLSGSKAQQVEEFPIESAKDLVIGRESGVEVRYDADRDDLVGRRHARILQDAADPFRFSLVDLNSRNGTFINKQRVAGTAVLSPGDVVQLGPGGPEFRFEIDPLPVHLVKSTRLSAIAGAGATRESAIASSDTSRRGVGKETVERLVGSARRESRRSMAAVAAVLVLAIVGMGYWWKVKADTDELNKPWSTSRLAEAYEASTVRIEFQWHIVLAETGEPIYHEYAATGDKETPYVPVFVRLKDGSIHPSLSTDPGAEKQNHAIACGGSGTGFIVSTDGYILTNRHVGSNWESYYSCFPKGPALLVTSGEKKPQVVQVADLPRWVPAKDGRQVSGKDIVGQNLYLDVAFKNDRVRFPATLGRVSDRADVAMLKVTSPGTFKKVETLDTYSTVKVGDSVTTMGYPGVSPESVVAVDSKDPLQREKRWVELPSPTVTPGTIGRIFRGEAKSQAGAGNEFDSGMGDSFQLTITATGAGNSGGPVFDDHGHVIGIFAAERTDGHGARVTFAVPIKFGLELWPNQSGR